jgi:hypothetical protein
LQSRKDGKRFRSESGAQTGHGETDMEAGKGLGKALYGFKGMAYRITGGRVSRALMQTVLLVLTLSAVAGVQLARANGGEIIARSEATVYLHDVLEGKAFTGPTGAVGMGAHHRETVLFSEGKFRSLACEEWGFEPGNLRADRVNGEVRFEAVHVSKDYGTMTWRGTIRDGKLEAVYVWEKERLFWTTRREYWFAGELEETGREHDHAL